MFRLIAITIFILAVSSTLYIRREAERAGEQIGWDEEPLWMRIGLRVFGLSMWLGILIALAYPPALAWATMGLPDAARFVGVAGALAMWPMMVWTVRTIGKNITQTVKIRTEHQLVTSGPYAIVRHPLYTFGTIFMISMALILDSGFILGAAMGGLVFLIARLPLEEARLIEAFGQEYRDYMTRTGGLVPKVL